MTLCGGDGRGFLDGCNAALDLSAGRHAVLPFMVFASMGARRPLRWRGHS